MVLPVRNEAGHLPGLLRQLRGLAENIILVDDASQDGSAALATGLGVRVIRHRTRRGKTSSIRSALPEALRSEWVLFMDADGQHDPADLERLWKARHGLDAVLGVRDLKSPQMPALRSLCNLVMSSVLHHLAGGRLSDTQCGYRLVRSAWFRGWRPLGKEYEWESELYGRLMLTEARVRAVTVKTIYSREKSKIFWPRETWRFLRTCLAIQRQKRTVRA